MRFVITLGVIAATTVLITPSKAQNYPWCAIYSGGMGDGGTNCGFTTFQQCMDTARGLGSFCQPNAIPATTRTTPLSKALSVLGSNIDTADELAPATGDIRGQHCEAAGAFAHVRFTPESGQLRARTGLSYYFTGL